MNTNHNKRKKKKKKKRQRGKTPKMALKIHWTDREPIKKPTRPMEIVVVIECVCVCAYAYMVRTMHVYLSNN